ncbi:MAG: DUF4493 domain-containing protein [Muribaculaceae bacterium]|nr:DUF4493 domain-containing protein [Muribaculaceae bacterium]
MIKQIKWMGVALSATAMTLTGCSHTDSPGNVSGKGSLIPNVELNTDVKSSQKSAGRATDITVGDLALSIKSQDGSFSKSWASVSEFNADEQFPIGQYTVEASYGSVEDEGFEKPAYYGTSSVTVVENQATPVNLTATLANSMVSIDYTDDFKNYMTSWNSQIHAVGGDYITFVADETRPAYVRPGDVDLNVTFSKPGTDKPITLKATTFKAQARHHYHITVDLKTSTGDAVLTVVLDDMLAREDVEIELSDELINAPIPTIKAIGFTDGEVINHVAYTKYDKDLKFNIIAHGELGAVTLTTQSRSLVGFQGFPAELDLLTADEATQARMTQLGFKCVGLWKNPEKMAVVDLSGILSHIAPGEGETTFSLVASDKLGKLSEVTTFTVSVEPQVLTLSNPSTLYIGGTQVAVDLAYNAGNPQESVKLEYKNPRGTWTQLEASFGARSRATDTYRVNLTVPGDNQALTIRATNGISTSDELVINRQVPSYSGSVENADIWGSKAFIKLSSSEADASALAKIASAFVSSDGATFTKATTSVVDNNYIMVGGLTPGTDYTVRISVTDDANQSCTPVQFTTEAVEAVPNGDFETLSTSFTADKMDQGGKWSISAGINYQSYYSCTVSEPDGWASVNKKTTSGETRNSWFVVPSTFNSTLTWQSTVPKIKVIGTGGGTETPDSYAGFTAHKGSNAMVIRNVAWDPKGSVPGTWLKTGIGSDEYYNHTVPSIANVSAGKLFLGTYEYSAGTETYNQGATIATRPAALSGWYQYTPDANDSGEKGIVTVQVLSGSTVIGTGSAQLATNLNYTLFNVPIKYVSARTAKATSVRVMISSSNHTDESQIKVSDHLYRYESARHGATLVVDNLTFAY